MRSYTALLIVLGALAQTGELRVDPSFPPVQSEQDIRIVIGSEAETRAIVHQAIELFFIVALTPADTLRSVKVLAAQLPSAWLPQVHGVTFDRLDGPRVAREWDSGCLRLMSIAVELAGGVLAVTVTEGNKCQRRRSVVEFTRSERGWQRGWGIRPVVEGGVTHCSCR